MKKSALLIAISCRSTRHFLLIVLYEVPPPALTSMAREYFVLLARGGILTTTGHWKMKAYGVLPLFLLKANIVLEKLLFSRLATPLLSGLAGCLSHINFSTMEPQQVLHIYPEQLLITQETPLLY